MTDDLAILSGHVQQLSAALAGLVSSQADALATATAAMASALSSEGKVLAAGNGGSAAEAQHLVGELIGRLGPGLERGPLAAVALTADSGVLTALANDYGYDKVFARQVAALARRQDVLVVLSTSGRSPNLVQAVEMAREHDVTTIGLLGGTRRVLHSICDVVVSVGSDDVQTIQECHLVLVHLLVELTEARLRPNG